MSGLESLTMTLHAKSSAHSTVLAEAKVPTPVEAGKELNGLRESLAALAAKWMRVLVRSAANKGLDSCTCPPDWRWEGDAIGVWKAAAAVVDEEMRAAGWQYFHVQEEADRLVRLYWTRPLPEEP